MSAREDQADVEKVLTRDISAFEGIVRRCQGPLVKLAYRFCGERGRAEEIAQEALPRAYRRATGRKDSAFSTWLVALAANLYRSELRGIRARMVALDDIAEPSGPRAADGGPESRDRNRALRRAVFALPPKYREALVLSYFHGMDVAPRRKASACPRVR